MSFRDPAPFDPRRVRDMGHPEVVGVDGCRGGWIGVRLGAGPPQAYVAESIAELLAFAAGSVQCLAIDMPIGLPDRGRRAAEGEVRKALPGRTSSVFSTLVRPAYTADSYEAGQEIQRAATGKGFSQQSWGLRDKILEVDCFVRSGAGVPVFEVHPELSFTRMAGAPMTNAKKSPAGAAERRAALAAAGIAVPARPSGAATDDLLDACAVAWSAARIVRGEGESHPEVPEVFSDGWPAAIWA